MVIQINRSFIYNEITDDINGIVYILEFNDYIKIGFTAVKQRRYKDLEKDFGDFLIIKEIETNTCHKTEKELHSICSKYNVILNEGCGRTEFFTKEILKLKEMRKWLK